MDTRNKIVSAAQALSLLDTWRLAGLPVAVVHALFDPLLAAHAAHLESALDPAARVLVQLEEGDAPVLPLRDRCELVAALRRVDAVCASLVAAPTHDWRAIHHEWKETFRAAVATASATKR